MCLLLHFSLPVLNPGLCKPHVFKPSLQKGGVGGGGWFFFKEKTHLTSPELHPLLLLFNDHFKMINNAWSHDSLTSCAELPTCLDLQKGVPLKRVSYKTRTLVSLFRNAEGIEEIKSWTETDGLTERFSFV